MAVFFVQYENNLQVNCNLFQTSAATYWTFKELQRFFHKHTLNVLISKLFLF